MSYRITHIHLTDPNASSTERIEKVKLEDGTVETVPQVVKYIDGHMEYYYTNTSGIRADVESVHPTNRAPFIRTVKNFTTQDNLLRLPRF